MFFLQEASERKARGGWFVVGEVACLFSGT